MEEHRKAMKENRDNEYFDREVRCRVLFGELAQK
jgi:hypothetical protein